MLKTEDLLDGRGGGDEKRMGLKQCASLLMCLSPPHPIPSCFGARARVSEPRNIMTVVTSEPIVSQFSALVVLKLTWSSNRLTQVHPPVSQRAALMKR